VRNLDPRSDAPETEHVAVDVYGIKANVRAGDLGEPHPTSAREALRQMRGHLLRIVVGSTRLIAEVLEGATRLIRGTTALPGSLATRLHDAHTRADHREEQLQEAVREPVRLIPAPEEEVQRQVERLVALLHRIRDRGRDGAAVELPDGDLLFLLGTAIDSRDAIEEAAVGAMRQLKAATDHTADATAAAAQWVVPEVRAVTGPPPDAGSGEATA
jgi:hypothetical protein